ncbi:MAG: putative bifunctional diguanylate cyclase/phosphodiesterase, partial [Pseudomonadales bacterium]
ETMSVVESFVNSICEDNFLSEGVKEWVKRLELTLNKLAMQDPRFFEDQSNQPHAAMQVLNQLAVLGNGLDEDENINRELGGDEIDSLLERVIEEFDDNPEIFGEVLKDLNPIVERQTRSYQGNLQRTVRACEGKQRLSSARMDVVGEVEKRLAGREVPILILDLLNPGWRNLLVHQHLHHGRDSESWNQSLDVLEQLVGQLSGRIQPDDPKYVQAPELLSAVESGFSSISFEPVRRALLLRRLSKALEGDSEKEMVLLDPNDSAKAVGLEDAAPETEPLSAQADPADQRTWRRWLNQARTLKVGDWLEVSDNSAGCVNLSLAWIGKQHVSFVLVDRKGIKAREITLREMVQSLMDGSIHPLDESNVPLMERASHRMLETLHNQLAHQASHDGLTGLVNRKEFEDRLEKAIITAQNKGQHHVVLYTDLDQFKIINNVAGHTAGDELLKILAAMLHDELRGVRGTLARLGGDEFGTLLEEVTTETGIEIAHRQIDAIRNYRFDWQERHFSLSACVGVVNVDQSVADVNEVMRNADAACYAAKEAGRNRVLMFEPDDDMAHRRGVMEQVGQIDRVLAEDRLLLNYQRIIPISADAPVAFEFLLRVLDEDGNVLAPAGLINAAETYNKMTLIDRWVVSNALQWMAKLGEELDEIGHFSINLSGNSLNDDDFADYVLDQLTSGSVPTNKICFEITETATIANRSHAVAFMDKMKVIGCQFALDDFGTGLSSYSYLRNMPVDYLKIDHIFVKDLDRSPGDYAVVKSINEIGHVMGKKTIAEGVENDDILKLVREIGVDYGQGYGIEKPRPITEFKL